MPTTRAQRATAAVAAGAAATVLAPAFVGPAAQTVSSLQQVTLFKVQCKPKREMCLNLFPKI